MLGIKRPEYIIVFRERAEKNASVLSTRLRVGQAAGVAARAGRVVLRQNHEWAAMPRLYQRVGIAVADLDANERLALLKEESVAAVIRNEVRRIPPIIEYHEGQEEARITGADSPASFGLHHSAEHDGGDSRLAYARGARDMAELFVRMMSASMPGAASPAAVLGTSRHSWALEVIGIPETYAKATGAGVRVAVLDTGIDLQHPDFAATIGSMDLESFVPGESVQDGNGHGTHCAGVIGGPASSTGQRRYAVAPGCELVIGKVLSDEGEGYDDQILDGIDWAADAGARIISMSLGSPRRRNEPYREDYEVVASTRLAESSGVLIIAAAGNESSRPDYRSPVGNPAACPSILAVAAVDRYRRVGYFSSSQLDSIGRVDVAAPGVGVYSAWKGSRFKAISGTSMATPHVAGVAALELELQSKLTPRQLWNRLTSSCQAHGSPSDLGAGIVQAP